jgi:hypothetical protein
MLEGVGRKRAADCEAVPGSVTVRTASIGEVPLGIGA